jgi:hypothetical protein
MMNLSDDPEVYAKQWFKIAAVGVIIFATAVAVFVL